MRRDAVGMFWNDAPVPKPPRPKPPKREPPERTWERPEHLPGLAEAQAFNVPIISDLELMSLMGSELYFDIECYTNFFQIAFMSKKTGHVLDFFMADDDGDTWDKTRIKFITENFILKGFNSWNYDIPMLSLALAGFNTYQLKECSDAIILYDTKPYILLKMNKVKRIKGNFVDLIEVAPSFAGLKAYGGRQHVPRVQELPFHPNTILSAEQMQIVRWYCVNDLVLTGVLDHTLAQPNELRIKMSNEIGIDLRSKSDAQVAEAVIGHELLLRTGVRPQTPQIDIGTPYRYNVPPYIAFQTPHMQQMLEVVRNALFVVDHTGSVGTPPELEGLQVKLGKATYTMGIGGLHSTEKSQGFRAQQGYRIFDVDVESYYPRIMLNLGLYPQHLGPAFLDIFAQIVERRVQAKRTGDKSTADSLKITINGTFGKLGNQFSIFYAPDLLVQTTITGQLSILMLIEMLEMYGIEVISANTDGIAIYVHESKVDVMRSVVKFWEGPTKFRTEETEYVCMFSKDVNNYIAIKPDGKFKGKGLYFNPWHASNKDVSDILKKNPSASVCVDAVIELLSRGTPLRATIEATKDFTKFVAVRHVSGGAVQAGEYLGKACRWYYSSAEQPEMVSAKSGNKVPKSDGAKPCMLLPLEFPVDVNFDWYVEESEAILKAIGYL